MNEYVIGPVEAIPAGEGREFSVGGRRIAVFHLRSGEVRAVQARCPHKDGPLADGLTGGGVVVCPYHSWKFDLGTGLPVFGTCGLTVHSARLSPDGQIVVTLDDTPDQTADSSLCTVSS
jgi:nitrite reductase (NADH) small subunit